MSPKMAQIGQQLLSRLDVHTKTPEIPAWFAFLKALDDDANAVDQNKMAGVEKPE